jgi:hypothetical protein
MLYCPLCSNNYIVLAKLCPDCLKIKNLGRIYGIQACIDLLEGLLVVKQPIDKPKVESAESLSKSVKFDIPNEKAKYSTIVKNKNMIQ